MEHRRRPATFGIASDGPDAAALREAAEILARAQADEAAADRARASYRTRPMAALQPDEVIARLLTPGEQVVAIRRSAVLDRRQAIAGAPGAASGLAGDLYLTSRQLVLVGRRSVSFDLEEIDEAMLSGDQLLLVMRDGQGASLGVAQPRLLRVQIAAARALART